MDYTWREGVKPETQPLPSDSRFSLIFKGQAKNPRIRTKGPGRPSGPAVDNPDYKLESPGELSILL